VQGLPEFVQRCCKVDTDRVHVDVALGRHHGDGGASTDQVGVVLARGAGADERAEMQDGFGEVHGKEVEDHRGDPTDFGVSRSSDRVGVGRLSEAVDLPAEPSSLQDV